MSKIYSGYLMFDKNDQTARIIYRNNSFSPPLANKREATEILCAMLGINISKKEFKAIRKQIDSSPLPDDSVVVEIKNDDNKRLKRLESTVEEILKCLKEDREKQRNIEAMLFDILEYLHGDGNSGEEWNHDKS